MTCRIPSRYMCTKMIFIGPAPWLFNASHTPDLPRHMKYESNIIIMVILFASTGVQLTIWPTLGPWGFQKMRTSLFLRLVLELDHHRRQPWILWRHIPMAERLPCMRQTRTCVSRSIRFSRLLACQSVGPASWLANIA